MATKGETSNSSEHMLFWKVEVEYLLPPTLFAIKFTALSPEIKDAYLQGNKELDDFKKRYFTKDKKFEIHYLDNKPLIVNMDRLPSKYFIEGISMTKEPHLSEVELKVIHGEEELEINLLVNRKKPETSTPEHQDSGFRSMDPLDESYIPAGSSDVPCSNKPYDDSFESISSSEDIYGPNGSGNGNDEKGHDRPAA